MQQTVSSRWQAALARAREFLRRRWQRFLRIRERVRFSEEAVHLLLAGCVGIIGGSVNLIFYLGIDRAKHLFLGRAGDPVEIAEVMGKWGLVLTPTLGGLAAGLVLYWGLRLVPQRGPTNLLEVVVAGDGKLPFRSAIIKAFSSLVSLGTGASIGQEGAITQLTATCASRVGQFAGWQPYRLRLLVGCGAASGIAAAYNAPISGAVFAALVVLGNFSMNFFAPLVFASVIASVVSRSFFGIEPRYVAPGVDFTRLIQLPWFLILGFIVGASGAAFLKILRWSENLFGTLKAPLYLRVMIGGLVVGLIALAYPGVWGNGYVITNRILHAQLLDPEWPLLALLGLFCAKMLATSLCLGAGTVGGLFTPTLFLGAAVGSAFGMTLHYAGQATDLPTTAFALVGMGCMLGATTHSPLLAMILVFEISLNYSLMPPLMLGCVISVLVARRLHPESIYTEPLRAKGLAAHLESAEAGVATERTVGDLMLAPVPPVRETAKLNEVAERFLVATINFLPVVDAKNCLVGMVALQDLKQHLGMDGEFGVIAYDIMRPPPPCVTPNQRLLDVLPLVLNSELRNIPVVNSLTENRLVGTLARSEVLGIFSEAISAGEKWG